MTEKYDYDEEEDWQEYDEKRRRKKHAKMLQHGRSLAKVYEDAVLKRLKSLEARKQKDKRKARR